ncbi:hypothetical protein KL911_000353 [Ogataea haglerorum]|uniref:uncharacterized protein n=1 Tax=Ogataea haglerorum TaxID=1937702 RepID=UPI001C89588E|nr:uncharacterized protein KL911_000353 [Ogataea haglerorum]KAG7748302.1 hypothetical protein KL912_002207 [Ogataea haglerorum]KAG7759216.1 hypothetical protein KL911_000353 [Ogataea haglerorum]
MSGQSTPSSPFIAHPHDLPGDRDLRKRLSSLEYQYSQLKDSYEIDKVKGQALVKRLERDLEHRSSEYEAAVSDSKLLFDESNKLKRELREMEDKFEQAVGENRSLRTELDEKTCKLNKHLHEFQEIEKRLEDVIALKDAELRHKDSELLGLRDAMREELSLKSSRIEELTNQVRIQDAQIRELHERNVHMDEMKARELYEKECSNQLEYIRELEKRNLELSNKLRALQSRQDYVQVLREEKATLSQKLATYEALETEYEDLKLRYAAMEQKMGDWPISDPPATILDKCSVLESTNSQLLQKHESLCNELARAQQEVVDLQSKLLESHDRQTSLKAMLSEKDTENTKLSNNVKLLSQEIQFLKDRIDNVTQENTMLLKNKGVEAENAQKFEGLVALLESYKQQLQSLRSQDTGQKRHRSEQEQPNVSAQLAEELKRKVDENSELLRTIEDKNKQLVQLELEVKKLGSSNENGVRVLELRENPAARHERVTRKMLDKLRQENRQLVAAKLATDQLIPKSVYERVCLEQDQLQEEIKSLNKRMTRLREMFSSKAARFNEIVFLLLGYKIELLSETKLKMYPKFNRDSFIQVDLSRRGSSKGQVLDGEGIRVKLPAEGGFQKVDVNNLIRFWVLEKQQPCCFFNALNLELYDKGQELLPN